MFEILLAEDYEDNWQYRDQERAESKDNKRSRNKLNRIKSTVTIVNTKKPLISNRSQAALNNLSSLDLQRRTVSGKKSTRSS